MNEHLPSKMTDVDGLVFMSGGGEMGEIIRGFDWSSTPLGSPVNWPDALRSAVSMCLDTPLVAAVHWGPQLRILYNDPYTFALDKKHPWALGRPFSEVWSEIWDILKPQTDRVMATGQGFCVEHQPLTLNRQGFVEETYWTYSFAPIRDGNRAIAGLFVTALETTRQVVAEQQRAELSHELAHRMKNTLAMVQAIATQTFRQTATMEEGRDAFSRRIAALSKAHDILMLSNWAKADIRKIVDGAIAPHQTNREQIMACGPAAVLTAQQGLGLSLALHELATNATKYGALSAERGNVSIDWTTSPDGSFAFSWTETGGPPVTPPALFGFGSRLLERIIAPYFDGRSELVYEPGGLTFKLNGSLSENRLTKANLGLERRPH